MEEALKALETIQKQFEEFKKKQEENISAKVDKQEIAAIGKQITDLAAVVDKIEKEKFSDAIGSIKKQMEEMAEDVAKAKENGGKAMNLKKSLGALVVEKLKEMQVTSKLGKSERKTFDIDYNVVNKVAGTMLTTNVDAVGTNSIPFSLSEAESGLTRVVRRRPWIIEIANTSTTSKKYVQWAEQENPDGGAAATAEGADKSQADFDWVEKSAEVVKVTAFIKVSKESLDDLDGLQNEIDTELKELVLLQADADLLSGDGVAPNLNGILNQDTAYSAGSFEGTVDSPNKYDVLRTAIAQVVKNHFIPNYILMHPDDVASMDLVKGDDGHYVLPPFKSADGMVISGVRILENTGQTVDKFTVGDFTKLNVKVREGFGIDVGYDGNDFKKNLLTILGEMRLVCYIKSHHQVAFVSGDFSDAITALDATS